MTDYEAMYNAVRADLAASEAARNRLDGELKDARIRTLLWGEHAGESQKVARGIKKQLKASQDYVKKLEEELSEAQMLRVLRPDEKECYEQVLSDLRAQLASKEPAKECQRCGELEKIGGLLRDQVIRLGELVGCDTNCSSMFAYDAPCDCRIGELKKYTRQAAKLLAKPPNQKPAKSEGEIRAECWDEAAKLAKAEGDEKGCMDCLSTNILADAFMCKAKKLRGGRK